MQVVIPYMSTFNGEISLKYALRSLEKFVPDVTDLFIIGDAPVYLTGFIHIPYKSEKKLYLKEKNIYEKIVIAIQDERVEEDFLYMHDDHFLLTTHTFFPDYFDRLFGGSKIYQNTVRNTNYPLNFDVHCPMVFNKEHFIDSVCQLDWDIPYGYCIKTEYQKRKKSATAMAYPDLKIRKPINDKEEILKLISGRYWFSIDDKALNKSLTDIFKELYPKPSRWEEKK